MNTTITAEHLHTACCLWEAALEALTIGENEARAEGTPPPAAVSFGRYLHRERENHGTATLRMLVAELAPRCDAAWDALSLDDRDCLCFDWDFVPRWLADNYFEITRGGR